MPTSEPATEPTADADPEDPDPEDPGPEATADADADPEEAGREPADDDPVIPEETAGPDDPAPVVTDEPATHVRALLGLALVLVAGRFVAAGDPTRPAWLLGYAAAGAGTGLVLAAAVAPGLRLWWRAIAIPAALVVQAGLVLGWSEPMDVTRAGPSAPVVLVAAGALAVALALWLAPAGERGSEHQDRDRRDGDRRDRDWPAMAAVGAAVGYGATLLGAARLLAFDIAEHVSPGAEIDGWLTDFAPLVVVAALATPVALGAIAAAQGSSDPGRVTAALVALATVPLAASGDGWSGLALAVTAVAAGAAAARWNQPDSGAGVAVATIVLGGTALAGAAGAGPTGVLAAALYGGVVGTLADVAASRAGGPATTESATDGPATGGSATGGSGTGGRVDQ